MPKYVLILLSVFAVFASADETNIVRVSDMNTKDSDGFSYQFMVPARYAVKDLPKLDPYRKKIQKMDKSFDFPSEYVSAKLNQCLTSHKEALARDIATYKAKFDSHHIREIEFRVQPSKKTPGLKVFETEGILVVNLKLNGNCPRADSYKESLNLVLLKLENKSKGTPILVANFEKSLNRLPGGASKEPSKFSAGLMDETNPTFKPALKAPRKPLIKGK